MIFRFYAVYNKREMLKISNQIKEKSQVLIKSINRENNLINSEKKRKDLPKI